MTSFYPDKLYPLQDKVCQHVNRLRGELELYLTGGTCLSRGYFNHRYSDDLDFFYHNRVEGIQIINKLITQLETIFSVENLVSQVPGQTFHSIRINDLLKVDFVCDVGKHWKNFTTTSKLYPLLDNPENILANKISAILDRDEVKDVVDIWVICKNIPINWVSIFTGVGTKAAGVLPPLVAKRLNEFPLDWLNKIEWIISPPTPKQFKHDIQDIVDAILTTD